MKVYFDPQCGRGRQWPGTHKLTLDHSGRPSVWSSIYIRPDFGGLDGLAILEATPTQLFKLGFLVLMDGAKRFVQRKRLKLAFIFKGAIMEMKKPMGVPAFKQTGNMAPMGQTPKVMGAPAFKGTSGTTAVNPKSPFSKGK